MIDIYEMVFASDITFTPDELSQLYANGTPVKIKGWSYRISDYSREMQYAVGNYSSLTPRRGYGFIAEERFRLGWVHDPNRPFEKQEDFIDRVVSDLDVTFRSCGPFSYEVAVEHILRTTAIVGKK